MADTEKFRGRYRVSSTRWVAWDYSSDAPYFVTICVANRAHDFGKIVNGEMQLTPLGQAAQDCWDEIPAHFPFVELGGFVVMPNHVHGVVIINKRAVETQNIASPQNIAPGVQTQNIASPPHDIPPDVQTQNIASLPNHPQNKFGPQSQNLASIIRGYKIGVTKFARQNNIPFEWQECYHDHVIRNEQEHERIHQYILTNPQRWQDDKFHTR